MNIKHFGKYILYMGFISCITLLPLKLTNSDGNIIKDVPSRIIIKSFEREYVPNNKEQIEDGGIRGISPVTKGKSGVQLLPVPDPNSPIILSPLKKSL